MVLFHLLSTAFCDAVYLSQVLRGAPSALHFSSDSFVNSSRCLFRRTIDRKKKNGISFYNLQNSIQSQNESNSNYYVSTKRGEKKKNKPTYRKFFIINVELLKAKNQYK